MTGRRRRGIALLVAAAVAGSATVATVLLRSGGSQDVQLVASTDATPLDGAAYVKEAIENLRRAERFRLTQTVFFVPATPTNREAGRAESEIDLSSASGDPPRFHSTVWTDTPDGQAVSIEQIAIGGTLYVRKPQQPDYKVSQTSPRRVRGKQPGAGVPGVPVGAAVDVIDPVMQMLEPVDMLPASSFATPSPVDVHGQRSVIVTLPSGDVLRVVVDDVRRYVVELRLSREGKDARLEIWDVGGQFQIETPQT